MDNINKLYDFLTLPGLQITLGRLDECVQCVNIDNEWKKEFYIFLSPYTENILILNFYGVRDSLFFERVGKSNYYKRVSIQ